MTRVAIAVGLAASLLVGARAGHAEQASLPSGSRLAPAPTPVVPPAAKLPGTAGKPVLPLHSRDPLAIRATEDPLLKLARQTAPVELLQRIVAETIARAPAAAEAVATRDQADAALGEAKSVRRPTVDVTITSYRVLSRNFGNNPENVIEQARPNRRTDQLLTVDQLLLDGGSANARIGASRDRLRAAENDITGAEDRIALETLAAWYDVFTYRSLVALADAFVGSQRELRLMVQERIQRGVSAEADVARVDSYTASAETRLARFKRLEAQAESRFQALTGQPAPIGLGRAPFTGPAAMSKDLAVAKAIDVPAVQSAKLVAEAARRDAKAARADRLPTISAGLDAGRYGIYETPRDYDVRARLTLRQRLFGGIEQREKQADARARAADARADRVAIEAGRDAEIAWSDVQALEEQQRALEATYVASRRSRDTIAERFRVASGTLFDVIGAEDSYFETAVGYLQAVTELDASRYVLLSKTGLLLPSLGVATDSDAAYGPNQGRQP
ncbi:TolC family protein [Sphingomonas sp. SUN019]|uniref:TolC family protein n=1 Tax=Sphingomonas sp. SUN019 TaxID=2937788 RepID=UPI0021648F05|nr:TolC family protein [Sphingomonas sp. SUN019]UVO51249.1 TolC family protein [Sphingomonas sp. SUN019]